MKKCTTILLIAATLFTASASAQDDPVSIRRKYEGTDSVETLLSQHAAKNTYTPLAVGTWHKQTISAHYDTATGRYLTVVTATRLDSIKLKTSLYTSGQILKFICTNSSNDSTLLLPSTGNINGDSVSWWWTGTYKNLELYFDGTNYWKL